MAAVISIQTSYRSFHQSFSTKLSCAVNLWDETLINITDFTSPYVILIGMYFILRYFASLSYAICFDIGNIMLPQTWLEATYPKHDTLLVLLCEMYYLVTLTAVITEIKAYHSACAKGKGDTWRTPYVLTWVDKWTGRADVRMEIEGVEKERKKLEMKLEEAQLRSPDCKEDDEDLEPTARSGETADALADDSTACAQGLGDSTKDNDEDWEVLY